MTTRHGQLANLTLRFTDLSLMLCALSLAIVINYAPHEPVPIATYAVDFFSTRVKVGNALLCGLMVFVWYLLFALQGVYRSHRLSTAKDEFKEVGRAVFLASVALLVIAQI